MPAPATVLTLLLCVLATTAVQARGVPDDRYLEGYASAVLEMRFGLREVHPRVQDGRLRLDPAVLHGVDARRVLEALRGIEGLEVELAATGPQARSAATRPQKGLAAGGSPPQYTGPLPAAALFDPLLADPRWPHFSASAQFYRGDRELGTVASANMGGTMPLYGAGSAHPGYWQLGVQAGVFSIFDLEAESGDLINADYFVGFPVSFRRDPFSAQLRLFHQSSHLGDEFLLRSRVNRINLSYEAVDLLLSLEPVSDVLRVYAGGGAILRSEPDLDPFSLQGGVELTSPWTLLEGRLRPLGALDLQAAQETGWKGDLSLRAGVEYLNPSLGRRRLQILLEYFNGHSPNGQFFDRNIEYLGAGVHFYF